MAQSIINILRDSGQLSYDPTGNSLTSTTAQGAIDENEVRIVAAEAAITSGSGATAAVADDVANLVTLSGLAVDSVDYGTFTGNILGDNQTSKVLFQTLETAVANLESLTAEFANSVLDYVTDNTALPASEVLGDRYILAHDGGAPNAAYDGAAAGDIVEFDGTNWIATTPTVGTFASADDETNVLYYFGGVSWTTKAFENTTASTGLFKDGTDIQIADASANAFSFTSGVAAVLVDDIGIEITANALNIKDLGVTAGKLASLAVVEGKIGDLAVTTGKINDLAVTTGKIADLSVTEGKLGAASVTLAKLGSDVVGTTGAAGIGFDQTVSTSGETTIQGELDDHHARIAAVEGVSGGWSVVTTATTMINAGKYAVNTLGGSFDMTFPATPSLGDSVELFDAGRNSEVNSFQGLRNGELINGVADDIIFDTVTGARVVAVFVGGAVGWSTSTAG